MWTLEKTFTMYQQLFWYVLYPGLYWWWLRIEWSHLDIIKYIIIILFRFKYSSYLLFTLKTQNLRYLFINMLQRNLTIYNDESYSGENIRYVTCDVLSYKLYQIIKSIHGWMHEYVSKLSQAILITCNNSCHYLKD